MKKRVLKDIESIRESLDFLKNKVEQDKITSALGFVADDLHRKVEDLQRDLEKADQKKRSNFEKEE